MKKLAICLIGIFITIFSYAQPVLTQSGNVPTAMQVFVENYFSATSMSQGSAGENVTWNFSNVATVSNTTIEWESAPFMPCADDIPEGEVAYIDVNSNYISIYSSTPSEYVLIGLCRYDTPARYSDTKLALPFPCTYNTTATDSFRIDSFPYSGNLEDYRVGYRTFVADGYGTLVLPTITYNDVLRIRIHETSETVKHNTDGTFYVIEADFEMYRWYKPGIAHPVFSLFNNLDNGSSFDGGFYIIETVVGVDDLNVKNEVVSIFPNPASNQIQINLPAEFASQTQLDLKIFTIDGRLVKSESLESVNTTVSVGDLPNGIYRYFIASSQKIIASDNLVILR